MSRVTRFPVTARRALGVIAGVLAVAVSAGTAAATALDAAADAFRPYLIARVGESLTAATAMRERVAAGDLAGAQKAWLAARGGWESVETVSDEFYPDLDSAIDAWPDAKSGFHAIEARLFGAHQLDVGGEADALVTHLGEFDQRLRGGHLTAQGLINGTAKLAFEIGDNKADGGESPYSGNSMAEVGANLAGIEAAYQGVFASALRQHDAAIDEAVKRDLAALRTLVGSGDAKTLDQTQLRHLSEDLTASLQSAATAVGLERPKLEN